MLQYNYSQLIEIDVFRHGWNKASKNSFFIVVPQVEQVKEIKAIKRDVTIN